MCRHFEGMGDADIKWNGPTSKNYKRLPVIYTPVSIENLRNAIKGLYSILILKKFKKKIGKIFYTSHVIFSYHIW